MCSDVRLKFTCSFCRWQKTARLIQEITLLNKLKTGHLYTAYSWKLASKALRMARFNDYERYLPATHTFIHEWNEPSCLYSTAAEHRRTLAGTISRPTVGMRLSWPGWLVTHRDGMPARRRSPIPVLTYR